MAPQPYSSLVFPWACAYWHERMMVPCIWYDRQGLGRPSRCSSPLLSSKCSATRGGDWKISQQCFPPIAGMSVQACRWVFCADSSTVRAKADETCLAVITQGQGQQRQVECDEANLGFHCCHTGHCRKMDKQESSFQGRARSQRYGRVSETIMVFNHIKITCESRLQCRDFVETWCYRIFSTESMYNFQYMG